MANFVYFLPTEQTVNAEIIAKYGLAGRLLPGFTPRDCTPGIKDKHLCSRGGPDVEELRGMVVGMGPAEDVIFDGNGQVWERIPGALDGDRTLNDNDTGYWIGYWHNRKPVPEDLQRAEMISGHEVVLADGHRWLVPVARSFAPGTALPQYMTLGPDGKIVYEVREEYRALFDRADVLASEVYRPRPEEELKDGIAVTVAPEERFLLALEALAVNYRLAVPEVNALRLFDTAALQRILDALIDFPSFIELAAQFAEKEERADADKKTGDDQPERDVDEVAVG